MIARDVYRPRLCVKDAAIIALYALCILIWLFLVAMIDALGPRIAAGRIPTSCPSAAHPPAPQSPACVSPPGAGRAFSQIDLFTSHHFWSQP
jgi:hypothetical protein